MRQTLAELRKSTTRGVAVVLDVGGTIAGYALLILFWSNELGGNICVIDELYVAPTHRGQKHASQLIEQLAGDISFFQLRPVAFEVEVTPRNKRARALYSRLGFNPAPNARLRKHAIK
jgi:ribosomal protein S18 acetylase RimI-like enzyme